MGLLSFLRRLLFPSRSTEAARPSPDGRRTRRKRAPVRVKLAPLRYRQTKPGESWPKAEETDARPYRFARYGVRRGGYLDLAADGDDARLDRLGLPVFRTPEQLAAWLEMPLGKLAWLVHRFSIDCRPESQQQAHYHFRWIRKHGGGWRLIEAPKQTLKSVQTRILREILDTLPPHAAAHGFVRGRSIVTNARPHVGQRLVVKLDLENFYATVSFARVVAIFRSLGYCREAAIWLGRLTTSALPGNMPFPDGDPSAILPFLRRHLPQGAPTSPALANLSAFGLDVRLAGLARSFGAGYSRYADDLTFSGPRGLIRALPLFLPLATKIVRSERFRVNVRKRRVIRNNQRQTVAGVVVNERTNVSRREYDRLKAILTNCRRYGPASQNREGHDDFAARLRGRIAHVEQLNPDRGAKLLELYRQVAWSPHPGATLRQ